MSLRCLLDMVVPELEIFEFLAPDPKLKVLLYMLMLSRILLGAV